MDALRQKSDQSLEDLSQEVRRLTYYVFADDPPARREAEPSETTVEQSRDYSRVEKILQ